MRFPGQTNVQSHFLRIRRSVLTVERGLPVKKVKKLLTRTFGTVSAREPSQRRSSTSSLHDEGGRRRGDEAGGGGLGLWSGAVRRPDPPALCACRLQTGVFQSRTASQSRTELDHAMSSMSWKMSENILGNVMLRPESCKCD